MWNNMGTIFQRAGSKALPITLAVCVAGAIEATNLSTDTKQQYELHASHTNKAPVTYDRVL